MSNAVNDDYGKKFQLTDSLLKRILKQEEYDSIKTIEPVIIVTDESQSKQLKNPGYKHAAVSSHFLYVINTPAKQESDLLLTVPLENVESVQMINDNANFLQGNLKENAQHTQLVCKHHCSIAESLLLKVTSLTLISGHRNNKEHYPLPLSSSQSSSNLTLDESLDSTKEVGASRKCKSLNTSPESSFTKDPIKLLKHEDISNHKKGKMKKQASNSKSKSGSSSTLHKSSSHRPLPKPLTGTEMLTASYTQAKLQKQLSDVERLPEKSSVKTKSSEDLTSTHHAKPINQIPMYLHQMHSLSSSSSHLSQSWNVILKAAQAESIKANDHHANVGSPSSSLNGSISSKWFKLMKRFRQNLNDSEASISNVESGIKTLSGSSTPVVNNNNNKEDYEEYVVDVYTVSKGSILFYILEQSWIYSVIIGTYKLETAFDSNPRKFSLASHRKTEKDAIIQKFTQLKEEILNSTQYDELFLLTKELKHACDNYLVIKKCVWKSAPFVKFYADKMYALVQSESSHLTDRMDELDVLILIGELFVSVFQDSGMISGRNMLLNDNSASFAKNLLDIILKSPQMKCLSKEKKCNDEIKDELFDLIGAWSDICVSILFEIINAAKQSLWCCTLDQRSFDVTVLVRFLCIGERKLRNLIGHIVLKLTSALSSEWEYVPSPSTVVTVYKSMFVLHFVCVNCPAVSDYVKTYYHEEVKYYISKEDNIKRIPTHYPVTCLITSFLPIVISTIT